MCCCLLGCWECLTSNRPQAVHHTRAASKFIYYLSKVVCKIKLACPKSKYVQNIGGTLSCENVHSYMFFGLSRLPLKKTLTERIINVGLLWNQMGVRRISFSNVKPSNKISNSLCPSGLSLHCSNFWSHEKPSQALHFSLHTCTIYISSINS